MLAMRRLQRAVNNKEKDIQDLKAEFEKNKKFLEQMVKEIKEKEEQAKKSAAMGNQSSGAIHNSSLLSGGMMGNSQISDNKRFSSNERRGISPNSVSKTLNPTSVGSSHKPRAAPQSSEFTLSDMVQQSHILPPKKGVIRAKNPAQTSNVIAEPRSLVLDNSQDPYSNIDKSGFNFSQPEISANNEDGGFNSLMEEIKRMQEENEVLKAQIG